MSQGACLILWACRYSKYQQVKAQMVAMHIRNYNVDEQLLNCGHTKKGTCP